MPEHGPLARHGLALAALAAALALPFVVSALGLDYFTGIATRILILALAGIGLNLALGYGGMVSFGHAAFFGCGAYVVGILSQHAMMGDPMLTWPTEIGGSEAALLVWPLAMIASALLALLIGALSLRTSGLYFIMITLAFAQMIYFFFVSLQAYGGDDGLPLFSRSALGPLDLNGRTAFYYTCLALVVLALVLMARLAGSRFGMALQGIRDNERRMRSLGFPTYRIKLTAFVISGAVTGLAGALIANQTLFVSPAFLDWHRSGELIIVVVLGGMGSLYGPLLGAAAYIILEEILSGWTQHWAVIFGPLLVLVALYGRRGLVSLLPGRRRAA